VTVCLSVCLFVCQQTHTSVDECRSNITSRQGKEGKREREGDEGVRKRKGEGGGKGKGGGSVPLALILQFDQCWQKWQCNLESARRTSCAQTGTSW